MNGFLAGQPNPDGLATITPASRPKNLQHGGELLCPPLSSAFWRFANETVTVPSPFGPISALLPICQLLLRETVLLSLIIRRQQIKNFLE